MGRGGGEKTIDNNNDRKRRLTTIITREGKQTPKTGKEITKTQEEGVIDVIKTSKGRRDQQ